MSYESCIHFKFGNITTYSAVKFHGLDISLSDLKFKILLAKRMNNTQLEIVNAQNKKIYLEETEMIPRNTSVIVKRIPPPQTNHSSKVIIANQKKRAEKDIAERIQLSTIDVGNQEADLYKIEESEDYVMQKMMDQASLGFDLSSKQSVKINNIIRCYACGRLGHHKDKCLSYLKNSKSDNVHRKRPKGIPSTMLEIIPGESINQNCLKEGIYVNRKGDYVIPIVDKLAMEKRSKSTTKIGLSNVNSLHFIPTELKCNLCHKLFIDAVKIQCCGNSFCDECIRNFIIENNFRCPLQECGRGEILPDNLIPNIPLRKAVKLFRAEIAVEKYTSDIFSSDPSTIDVPSKDNFLSKIDDPKHTDSLCEISIVDPRVGTMPQYLHSYSFHNSTSKSVVATQLPVSNILDYSNANAQSISSTFTNDPHIPNEEFDQPSILISDKDVSTTISHSHLYPLLSEKEFYLQQSLYRKREELKGCCNEQFQVNILNPLPLGSSGEFIGPTIKNKDNFLQVNDSVEVLPLASSDQIESDFSTKFEQSYTLPMRSSISPVMEYAFAQSSKSLKSEKSGSPFHDSFLDSNSGKYLGESNMDSEFLPFASDYPLNKSETPPTNPVLRKLSFVPFLNNVSNSNNLLSHSLSSFTRKANSGVSSNNYNELSNVEPIVDYDNISISQHDSGKLSNQQFNYYENPLVSRTESSIFTPLPPNDQYLSKRCDYKSICSYAHQNRLQSTVKKVSPTTHITSIDLCSEEHSSKLTSTQIQRTYSPKSSQSSTDSSSELEDGQIVSSGSGSHCIQNRKKYYDCHKRLAVKSHRRFSDVPMASVYKSKEPICSNDHMKDKCIHGIRPMYERKTPDRIVVIKPSSNFIFQGKHKQRALFNKKKRSNSDFPSIPMVYRNYNRRKHSRLLMTKTDDQRIVEITTTKKFISRSKMSLLRDKRKRIGFVN
ncbi:hypothetical protein LOD99_2240 [Oopsacas minuta]|uniref:Uncharacterized protein n=1 Tax=Oopsacas minuta TaxID=111878 RepID=A0AAV7K491_9METZ|nr:hypothetical protein LOD99_2240 [Oopsacas minuta]